MFHGISAFRLFWQRLLARLRYCGGAHYLAGAPSLPPPLTPEQEKALLARMAEGDACARDDLITHNLRLVVYLAKKYENSGVPAEDMISIGTIGLIKAVNTFTPERSIKLATYASRCIGNEILPSVPFRAAPWTACPHGSGRSWSCASALPTAWSAPRRKPPTPLASARAISPGWKSGSSIH